jgi:hypothetical protein
VQSRTWRQWKFFYTNLDTQDRSRKYGASQGAAVGPVFYSVVFSDSGGAPVQRFSLRMETKTGFYIILQ